MPTHMTRVDGNSRYPSLYQINTRVLLNKLATERLKGERAATLDDISDQDLDSFAGLGFDWLWFLSVWQTGTVGRDISRAHEGWRREFAETLPDLSDRDIEGSGFAITAYSVHEKLGGPQALSRLREKLKARGQKLLLDFVPNHTGVDHHWVKSHPEYYVAGSEEQRAAAPQNFITLADGKIFAHGRDPYFDGWPDTLQLDYANPALQEAMVQELLQIASQCDGVRCDMAMLVLPDVFERTWGRRPAPFWAEAIQRVKARYPDFIFMAEVYWDLEWQLQELGFDYTYDKRLYDRLHAGEARPVREHLLADFGYQNKMARFLENHDEPRAASVFAPQVHKAAAVITYFSPGLRFFHQGQFEGRKKRISPHLVRGPNEVVDSEIAVFYQKLLPLLGALNLHHKRWHVLNGVPAWEGNWTADSFVCFAWECETSVTGNGGGGNGGSGNGAGAKDSTGEHYLIVVNYAPHQSQCYLHPPFAGADQGTWQFKDSLSGAVYEREGANLAAQGLYLDMSPWQACIFVVKPTAKTDAKSGSRSEACSKA